MINKKRIRMSSAPVNRANTIADKSRSPNTRSTYANLMNRNKLGLTIGISMIIIAMFILYLTQENEEELIYSEAPDNFSPDIIFNITDTTYPYLASQGKEALQEFNTFFPKLRDMIIESFPCLFSFKLLMWMLAPKPTIIINPELTGDWEIEYFMYWDKPGEGFIQLSSHPYYLMNDITQNTVNMLLRKRLFYRTVDVANRNKPYLTDNTRQHPFLNADGQIDSARFNKFYVAIRQAYANVDKLKMALKNNNTAVINATNEFLSDYIPISWQLIIRTKKHYEQLKKAMMTINGQKVIPKGTLFTFDDGQEQLTPHDLVFMGLASKRQKMGEDMTILVHHHGSKAEIFVRDFDSFDENLQRPAYQAADPYQQATEIGSNLEIFSPKIKQRYFKEYCRYMGQYTGVGENDYCAIPSYARCTMK